MNNAERVKEQAQVFASAWSLVGGVFDTGGMLEDAEEAKAELHKAIDAMQSALDDAVAKLAARDAEVERLRPNAERYLWLRRHNNVGAAAGMNWTCGDGSRYADEYRDADIDEAIDAALSEEVKGGE